MSHLEEIFQLLWRAYHPEIKLTPQHKFLKERRFRFDFAHPSTKVAIEIEGGIWSQGRHTTGSGFQKDCEKYNLATMEGWSIVRLTEDMIAEETIHTIANFIKQKESQRESWLTQTTSRE